MATLVFSAIGTTLGGPLGGAIGALAGRQLDGLIMPGTRRAGPRLAELAISTSSYGATIPRHFGRMRVAGTVIWATDLVEQEARQGGKGTPATTTYSYSASFAVALSSRPVLALGRIWADGKLLRGSAGDLKVGGTLRLHHGYADQAPDPFIASAEPPGHCPAYRSLAYAVFEDLALGEFGNRIPALTFEVVADAGPLTAAQLLETLDGAAVSQLAFPDFQGLTLNGAPAELFGLLGTAIPLYCQLAADRIEIGAAAAPPVLIGAAALAADDGEFGPNRGEAMQQLPAIRQPVGLLRYYDQDRDYQPGAQRAFGSAALGEVASLDLPVTMSASQARGMIEHLHARNAWAQQVLIRRQAELDSALTPGRVVILPNRPGLWKVRAWEWRAGGVELELVRVTDSPAAVIAGSAGRAAPLADLLTGPSVVIAFELPEPPGSNSANRTIHVAAAAAAAGWQGGALYAESAGGELIALGYSVRRKAIIGTAAAALPPHSPHLLDRSSVLELDLLSADMALSPAGTGQLLQGANLALLGEELIQFGRAEQIAGTRWRLSVLARGRGGDERAVFSHAAGERFVLLDDRVVAVTGPTAGTQTGAARIAIIGLGDSAPAFTAIARAGRGLAPLAPVHGRVIKTSDDRRSLQWVRRSRGAWVWPDSVEVPLGEQAEAWLIEFAGSAGSLARWSTSQPRLAFAPGEWTALMALVPEGRFTVQQVGTHAMSQPLVIDPQCVVAV